LSTLKKKKPTPTAGQRDVSASKFKLLELLQKEKDGNTGKRSPGYALKTTRSAAAPPMALRKAPKA